MSHEDEVARLRAQMDQAAEGANELARSMWAFYSEAVAQGFSPDQALTLAVSWLTAMATSAGGDRDA